MNGTRRVVVFCVVLVCLSLATTTGGASAQSLTTGEYTGAALELTPEQKSSWTETMDELVDQYPVQSRDHVFSLRNERGYWVVFSDREPKAGLATVEGTAIELPERDGGVIFADSVTVDQQGEPTDLDTVLSNPSAFEYDLVRVTTTVNSLSYAVEAGGDSASLVEQQSTTVVGAPTTRELVGSPGLSARSSVRELADETARDDAIFDRIGSRGETVGFTRSQTRMWASSRATLDVLVLPVSDGVVFYVVDRSVAAADRRSLRDLATSDSDVQGTVTRTEANALGVRISGQETLLEAARCAPTSVVFPQTGCLPVPADTVVHAGVLYDGTPDGPTDVVFYGGLSNRVQNRPVTIERGRYDVAGRVTTTQSLSPALPNATALAVYEMNQVRSTASPPSVVQSYSSSTETRMREQLTSGERAESRPATTTPTPETAAPSESQSQQSTGTSHIEVRQASLTQSRIEPGQSVGVRVTVENTGAAGGETALSLQIGNVATSETIRVAAGQTKTITMGMTMNNPGEQTARVNGKDIGTVTVGDSDSRGSLLPPDVLGVAGIGLGALAYLGGWAYVINQSPRLRRLLSEFIEWLAGAVVISLFVGLLMAFGVDPILSISAVALMMIGVFLGQRLG